MRTCQCRKTMGRAGRDGPVRLPGIDRVLRPGILWPGIWPGRRHHDHLHGQRSARGCPGFGRRRAAASQQGGALPPMLTAVAGGITPPALFLYSWLAPVIHHAAPALPRLPISPAPWRDCRSGRARRCRLTPVTRTRRIPALTGGMLPLMRRAYCPAAGVLCRRSHSESCLGTGPDVRSISGRTPPCLAERRSFKVQENSHVQKIIDCRPGLAAAPQLLWAHAHGTATPAKDAVLAKTPATVTLTLTEGLEAAFSSLTLQDAAGKTVPTEKSALAPGDNKTLVLPIGKDLPAGVYTVEVAAIQTRPMAPGRSRSSPASSRRRRAQAMIIATFALLRFVAYMASTLLPPAPCWR